MKHNLWHIYARFNILVIVFGIALFGYWYFIDGTFVNVPVVFQEDTQKLATDKAAYQRGQEIRVQLSFCKYSTAADVSDWRMEDGITIAFTQMTATTPVGCYGAANSKKPYFRLIGSVPEFVDDGVWHLAGTIRYQVNPVRSVVIPVRTVDFIVIGKDNR